jgi:hypothetical protein
MSTNVRSTSPHDQYVITVDSWEARMSLWIDSPALTERRTGENLLAFEDPNWSLDAARWLDDSTVVLTLRKYPGNHTPGSIDVTVDCAGRTATIGGAKVGRLGELEQQMEKALRWI